jgi:hypothetical protein
MNYDYAQSIVLSEGWDVFLEILQKQYSSYDLYSVSKYWFEDDNYICKAKGIHGDVIIEWEHKQVS